MSKSRDIKLEDKYGLFNPDYLLNIQILGRPAAASKAPEEPFVKSRFQALKARFWPAAFAEIQEAVEKAGEALWTRKPMKNPQGDHNSTNHFERRIAERARAGDYVFRAITADVNFDFLLPASGGKPGKAATVSLRREWNKAAGSELPAKQPTWIYILAPRKYINLAESMIRQLAAQKETGAIATLRGDHFIPSVAFQALNAEQKAKIKEISKDDPDNAGWFEIGTGIFWTIDPAMYRRAQIAFAAKPAPVFRLI